MYDQMLPSLTATQLYPRTQVILPQLTRAKNRNRAILFFVQCMCQYLTNDAAQPLLAAEVKLMIRECVQRNRAGDPSCVPLRSTLLLKLRRIVGQYHWTRALLRFELGYEDYCSRSCGLDQVRAVQTLEPLWHKNDTSY